MKSSPEVNSINTFKPYYIKSLPWDEKTRNEFFSQKECKRILRDKYIQYIF